MFERLRCFIRARWRFRGYEPQPVTVKTVCRWVGQFSPPDRKYLPTLLKHIRYVDEQETRRILFDLNRQLVERLANEGIPIEKIIYVQVDEAGSSSPFMLGLLKNDARLDRLDCKFVDSRDVRMLRDTTDSLEEGAIIYVDDFAGTGRQFCRSRDFVIPYTVGNFAEFFLVPFICEEAVRELAKRGVEPITAGIHKAEDRLLRTECTLVAPKIRDHLTSLSSRINPKWALGDRNMGAMIVFYRNAPNSVPLILRGSLNQDPYVGILPRSTDLPPFF